MWSSCAELETVFLSLKATGRPHHKTNGIMNSAFDNPERPHTPSFIGSYSSVHDPHPPAAYVYGADEPGRKGTIISTSASTVGFLPPEKKKRRNKSGRNCIVVMLLACFIVLSIVMIVLYFTRPFKTGQESEKIQDNGTSQVLSKPFKPQYQHAGSPHSSPYISYGNSWENLLAHQDIVLSDHLLYSHDLCV